MAEIFFPGRNSVSADQPQVGSFTRGFRDEVFVTSFPSREVYRQRAEARVAEYLETPGERVLREHQVDVFESLFDLFKSGKTAGTIVLPTGAGKTHVAAELIRVLGVPSTIFSTSIDIMNQNGETIRNVAPNTAVTNFYGDEKNLNGDVINTLYQSFPSLSRAANPDFFKNVGLVIYDEADLSLGEERHKIHAQFPNAIKIALTATPYYEQINGYIERGIVDPNEEWVETFTNIIHEMSVEEAFERKVIPPLDIHLVRTSMSVPNLTIDPDGDFSTKDLAKYLNTKSRNALAIAMICGLDYLPPGITIQEDTKEAIRLIHEKINGKRTVIHGMNVNHILALEKELLALGISAKAIYGEMKEDRKPILDKVKSGEIQVILGDKLTGRGLDIPELEASIHMAPTLSSRDLAQELGRLFRHSPQTGKEKGIAIQLVDTHKTRSARQPVLIPSIFDPDFVLRGTTKGREIVRQNHGRSSRSSIPSINIDGTIDLDAYFEEIRLQDIIQSRFRNANLEEMNSVIMNMYDQISTQHDGNTSIYELYQTLVKYLPNRISGEANQQAISAIGSGDIEKAKLGKQVLLFLNLKTIMGVLEPHFTLDTDRNSDLVEFVFADLTEKANSFHDRYGVTTQINNRAKNAARRFTAAEAKIPVGWVNRGVHKDVIQAVEELFSSHPDGVDEKTMDEFSGEIGKRFGINQRTLTSLLETRNEALAQRLSSKEPHEELIPNLRKGQIENALASLDPREKVVLEMRFGLGEDENKTLDVVGRELKVTRERVRQIEAKALRKLRHPSRSKGLRDFLD